MRVMDEARAKGPLALYLQALPQLPVVAFGGAKLCGISDCTGGPPCPPTLFQGRLDPTGLRSPHSSRLSSRTPGSERRTDRGLLRVRTTAPAFHGGYKPEDHTPHLRDGKIK